MLLVTSKMCCHIVTTAPRSSVVRFEVASSLLSFDQIDRFALPGPERDTHGVRSLLDRLNVGGRQGLAAAPKHDEVITRCAAQKKGSLAVGRSVGSDKGRAFGWVGRNQHDVNAAQRRFFGRRQDAAR